MVKAKKMMFTSILAIVLLIGIAVSFSAGVIFIYESVSYSGGIMNASCGTSSGDDVRHRAVSKAGLTDDYGNPKTFTISYGYYSTTGSAASASYDVGLKTNRFGSNGWET